MKKSFFLGFIAFAALTMMSCTNDETTAALFEDNAIEFGSYAGRAPQKAPGLLNNVSLKDFGVFASYTEQKQWAAAEADATMNFMFNQKVEHDGTSWVYTPKKYWPAGNTTGVKAKQYISFFAYAPYWADNSKSVHTVSEVSTNTDKGCPKVKFVLPPSTTAAALVDLSAAVATDQYKDDATADDNKVKFTFKHVLSRLNFVAKLDREAFGSAAANKTKINITNVAIEAQGTAYTEGIFNFSDDASNAPGYWSDQKGTAASTIVVDGILDKKAATELGDYQTEGVSLKDGNRVALFSANNYLYFIPGSKIADIKVTFTYDIVTYDDAVAGDYTVSHEKKTVSLTGADLAQGTAYVYVFTFKLQEIVVEAEVSDAWADGTEVETPVDWPDLDI